MSTFSPRTLPQQLESLTELTLDLRWTWSNGADALWKMLDQEAWERTKNPWILLQNLSQQRLQQLADDAPFCQELNRLTEERAAYQCQSEISCCIYIGQFVIFSFCLWV
jgi:starch phosphorylase